MRSETILSAAATLLGVALLIVTGVHIAGRSAGTIADEVAFASALMFIGCCLTAHLAIRRSDQRLGNVADKLFFIAQLTLLFAALCLWF